MILFLRRRGVLKRFGLSLAPIARISANRRRQPFQPLPPRRSHPLVGILIAPRVAQSPLVTIIHPFRRQEAGARKRRFTLRFAANLSQWRFLRPRFCRATSSGLLRNQLAIWTRLGGEVSLAIAPQTKFCGRMRENLDSGERSEVPTNARVQSFRL